MNKALMPIIAIVLLATAGYLWVTRGATALDSQVGMDAPYVNEKIGTAFKNFGEQMVTNPEAAAKELEVAKSDPENGLTNYFLAALKANQSQLGPAIKALKEGNVANKVVYYIVEPPAHEMQTSLSTLRRLNLYAEKISTSKDKEAESYFRELRIAGYRIAAMEPPTTLTLATGMSILNGVYNRGDDFWKTRDPKTAEIWKKDRVAFKKWVEMYQARQAVLMQSIPKQVGKMVGLNEAEMNDVGMRRPLADAAKQAKVDEAMQSILQTERDTLIEVAKAIPVPTPDL
jgi:hypothetical protein